MCDGIGLSQFAHREYDVATGTCSGAHVPFDQMAERSFFTSAEISALPQPAAAPSALLQIRDRGWLHVALPDSLDPDEEIRFIGVMDSRRKIKPQLPVAYYGNVAAAPVAITTQASYQRILCTKRWS